MKFSYKRYEEGEMPVTRDGRKVLDIYQSTADNGDCMVAWIEGITHPMFYTRAGRSWFSVDDPSLDLVHPTRNREERVVMYYGSEGFDVFTITEAECHMDTLDEFIEVAREHGRLIKVITVNFEE